MQVKFKINKKIIIAIIVFILLFIFFYYQNKHIVTSNYIYESAKVGTDLDGYRIVCISDLHNASFGKNNKKLLKDIKDCSPDIIVITGDLVDSNHTNIERALDFAEQAANIAPVYYVTGNHEYWLDKTDYEELMAGLSDIGVIILNDSIVRIDKGNSSFMLAGLDDNSLNNGVLKDLVKDSNDLVVVLAHEPQYITNYANSNVDLVLSGHAHGGQFKIPFAGGVYAPDQGFFPQYVSGKHIRDNTELIISRGLGNSVIPIRLFNYPEIVVVELKRP